MGLVRNKNEVYVIAEIGQNHNGDINIAKKIIDQLDRYTYDPHTGNRLQKPNAIKLTKRDLSEELSVEAADRPYVGKNSFGKTYGEHREFLELSYQDHVELGNYARSKGFDFIITACSPKATKVFDLIEVDYIKVASRDLTNIPLLEAIAKRKQPVIISTGMVNLKELSTALNILKGCPTAILHCISQYPAEYGRLNLRSIAWLQENYYGYPVGFSDHSIGVTAPLAAVALGARIIEKHVTLDTNMKGSDHAGSADIETFHSMVNQIRLLEQALGEEKFIQDSSFIAETKVKLERSLAFKDNYPVGHIITADNFHMLSPGNGLKWDDVEDLVGRELKEHAQKNSLVTRFHF